MAKNQPTNAGDIRDAGLILVGKIPEGEGMAALSGILV